LAESFGLKETKGVLIADVVADGPAHKAGLERGDIVLEFDGRPVETSHDLSRRVAAVKPGTETVIKVLRNGREKKIQVTIGTMPEDGAPAAEPAVAETPWGLTVQNLTPELAQRFGWDESEKGVIVTEVEPGSPASDARITRGDLIKEVNREKIQNLRDYKQAVERAGEDRSLLLLIKRGEHTFYVVLAARNGE
jgi:serine protease Do